MALALRKAQIVGGFSCRRQGNMSLVYGQTQGSLANRRAFLSGLGIDYRRLVCAEQVHAGAVYRVREVDAGRGALDYANALPKADALITDGRDLPLAIFSADCLPVFFYDSAKPAIGLAHAGWRSVRAGILANTVKLMQEEFNTRLENLYAGFGPAIRDCCYEVGSEFREILPDGLIERKAGFYLDLAEANKKGLLRLGLKVENIFDCAICTSCRNRDYFSFRREGKPCGRMMSVAMLKGGQ